MKSHKVSWHRVNEGDDLRFHPHGNIMIHHTVSLYVIHVIQISATSGERTYHELLVQQRDRVTVTSDKGIWNHLKLRCLVKSSFMLTKKIIKGKHHWPFVRGIHQWQGSPHKWPVMWKVFPWTGRMLCLQIPCLWSESAICMSPGGHCWDYYPGTQWGSQKILQLIRTPCIPKSNLQVRDLKMCCRDSTLRWIISVIVMLC